MGVSLPLSVNLHILAISVSSFTNSCHNICFSYICPPQPLQETSNQLAFCQASTLRCVTHSCNLILEEYLYCVLISCDLLDIHTISATTVVEGSSLLGIQLKSAEEKSLAPKLLSQVLDLEKICCVCCMKLVEGC